MEFLLIQRVERDFGRTVDDLLFVNINNLA